MITRYEALFRPDLTCPSHVLHGVARVYHGIGSLFQPDGCNWTVNVANTDSRLIVGKEIRTV
jgi:hypothetical protein